MAVNPVPEGFHTCTPYLIIDGAEEAIDFYKKALDATEVMRMNMPDTGKIAHAEIQIGDSRIMLSNEWPDMGHRGPNALGGTPISLHLYVKDVDAAFKKAIAAGGVEQRPVQDQFYGDRSGTFVDPFGHIWHLSTHVKSVSPEEMAEGMKQRAQDKS